jgi:hypothetical protein
MKINRQIHVINRQIHVINRQIHVINRLHPMSRLTSYNGKGVVRATAPTT